MADILIDRQGIPATPASGQQVIYVESLSRMMKTRDDLGYRRGNVFNYSTASQAPAAATRTYIVGSAIPIYDGLQVGTCFRWVFNITKTGAGTAASTYDVAVGTNGGTGDPARLSFTKPAGTANADEGLVEIRVVVRAPIIALGTITGEFTLIHNLAATGHATIPCVVVNQVSGTFDLTGTALIFGVCITSGASDAITIQMVQAEAWNL